MIQRLLLIFLIGISPCLLNAQEMIREEDRLLSELHTEKDLVGVAAAYSIDGEIIWKGQEGFSCEKQEIPFTTKTLTRTASIAKMMTAVAILQLVEMNQVHLDAPVQTYLPEFPRSPKGPVTVRQLLNHTSGISQYQNSDEVENTINYTTLEEACKVFMERPLLFEPGSEFFYTTYGYVVLGRIIEVVSHQSYEEYMRGYIWGAAGMYDTGIEHIDKITPEHACVYHRKKKKAKEADRNDLSNRVPGGGLYSTVEDLVKFGDALINYRMIDSSSLALMMQAGAVQKEGNPYALGCYLYGPPPNENLVIGHSGEQTGAATQIMIIPKSKTVVAAMSNTSGTWKDIVTLTSELIRISEEK